MMSAGLEKQLLRCNGTGDHPDFCNITSVYGNVLKAYNNLWDSIEQVQSQLRTEVWSWVYHNGFVLTPLGDLPAPGGAANRYALPPSGISSPTYPFAQNHHI
jgi:hypothetical protein